MLTSTRINYSIPLREHTSEDRRWYRRGRWPGHWIMAKDAGAPPFVLAFRLPFALEQAETLRFQVSADERYELYVDGRRIGRGSERGDLDNWFFETYEVALAPGRHTLVARVWAFGPMAPYAQTSMAPGFILMPEEQYLPLLGTGVAAWEGKKLNGYAFVSPGVAWGTGCNLAVDAALFDWGFETGDGAGWQAVDVREEGTSKDDRPCYPPARLLRPALLPEMLERPVAGGTVRLVTDGPALDRLAETAVRLEDDLPGEHRQWDFFSGRAIVIPPQTRRRVLIDLNNYYCAYPELVTSGGRGSLVRLQWAEALYQEKEGKTKGQRDQIVDRYFFGVGDTFKPDGGPQRQFQTLWWQAGRYLELYVETAAEPLCIDALRLWETRYPLELESAFSFSDPRLERIVPIALRGLQMCAHETYMDCPYYEQLMYVGDTRLEALVTYAISRDDRLAKKALQLFAAAPHHTGLTRASHPNRITQIIPPFSLWWVMMLHDQARWRGDRDFVRSLMPRARMILDAFLGFRNGDGLIEAPKGWNFADWVPAWEDGIPPDGEFGVGGLVQWQFILALTQAAQLEQWLGEPELARRAERLAGDLAARTIPAFWDEARGLFADDLGKRHFSEHTQCLAILSGHVPPERLGRMKAALLTDPALARTTIYFTHYLFEALGRLGEAEALFHRLALWFDLEPAGLKTPYETPEPTRSDCHGWGAHPLYHYYATILGVRPADFGFQSVAIAPLLGALTTASGRLVHPAGTIEVAFHRRPDALSAVITLPRGVPGTLFYQGTVHPLHEGRQELMVPLARNEAP